MQFKGGRFVPSGVTEHLKLCLTCLSAATQVGLNITLSVLIGAGFRSHAPWAFLLAVALAAAWTASLLHFGASYFRLVRFVNKHQEVLKESRSALVLPLGAESLAAALGSAFLSGAVVWIAKTARVAATDDTVRFGQFDIYFPVAIGFQILALPSFVRLADIFGYAQSKAKHEVKSVADRAVRLSQRQKVKEGLVSGSTQGSLISVESVRAAQKELELAKARLEEKEKRLASISTGASAQSLGPAPRFTGRPLVPMVEHSDRKDRRDFERRERENEIWEREVEKCSAEEKARRRAERRERRAVSAVSSAEDPPAHPDVCIDMPDPRLQKRPWFG